MSYPVQRKDRHPVTDGRTIGRNPATGGTVDPADVARFEKLAKDWWDPWGPMRPLHKMNPLRAGYIAGLMAEAFDLPLTGAGRLAGRRILDIGCGTGRSLVGLAPHLPEGSSVIGLDVFDDRIILGNAPLLARRNARKAGIDVVPVRGDAARIPLTENSQDLVTACRVLHDLPEENHERTLREIRRVCRSGGVLGILEIPVAPGERDPETYWREQVEEAGFAVQKAKRVPRAGGGEPYIVIVAEPSPAQ